ncbi:hypothetical protein Pcinc_004609 [Petrolisthes cinctipes]|uniref:Uncharacterized protein n=1 Tax=Petrolisthes cinctipes TaxID=88211 RepID=A0AAE1FFT1_PETCI|nr:hypothetical protein Pcinc_022721 [Petrolisthes cinctipes]KAK3881791.1 hypothetical protein Pcinc_013787 [Petrolisthes cinctipes]KAK3891519.1 hypothetical protein Pcinc_004609 [Petrolisthes cinctipes]
MGDWPETKVPMFSSLRADTSEYLARYLFIKTYKEESLHYFLLQAAKLYPPQGDQPPQPHPLSEDEFSDGFSGFSDDDYPDDPQPGPSQR